MEVLQAPVCAYRDSAGEERNEEPVPAQDGPRVRTVPSVPAGPGVKARKHLFFLCSVLGQIVMFFGQMERKQP
jgi:hypothetical protein